MTLIVGLKSANSVVIAAETEEGAGTSKRTAFKLDMRSGQNWVLVVGGAGNGVAAESAMRKIFRKLPPETLLTEEKLEETIEDVIAEVHDKYIDPDPESEGLSLIVGAVSGSELYLISTARRGVQFQEEPPYAYAGYDSSLAVYFFERAEFENWNGNIAPYSPRPCWPR